MAAGAAAGGGAAASATSAAAIAGYVATAVAIASTIYSVVQANELADAQEEAQKKQNEQVSKETIANYEQLSEAELALQQQTLDATLDNQKGYIKEKGRINVMAAAMGTGGMSVSSQLSDLERVKYSNYNTILLNRQAGMDNIADQAESLRYQAAGSMNVSPISRPSWAAAALDIGSQALGGYADYQKRKEQADLLSTTSKKKIGSGG